jgi:hypothetical protein
MDYFSLIGWFPILVYSDSGTDTVFILLNSDQSFTKLDGNSIFLQVFSKDAFQQILADACSISLCRVNEGKYIAFEHTYGRSGQTWPFS